MSTPTTHIQRMLTYKPARICLGPYMHTHIIDLVWFYGLSTIVGQIHFYTVLFQTIQFNISTFFVYTQLYTKQFYFKLFSLV